MARITLLFVLLPCWAVAEVLTPPYFNLAENRRITATATCGENVNQPELYCKLVGASAEGEEKFNLIQGQICDVCDPNNPDRWHPPQYAIDGSEKWWQSPPLSRGMQFNQVNLTVDLGQLFQVAYVLIKMGNSPRPGVWVLERSVDNGQTYSAWQYFADSPNDCVKFFGEESLRPIVNDDDVTCTTQFSKVVPLEGGEIVVSLLNERPSARNFFNSSVLQEFTRATNVRMRFLRTKTLLGHLMSVARQDPTVTRRYFYSVKDISIGGRCVCNGHAGVCDIADPNDPYELQCRCEHNTCGSLCEYCCPGYIQKKWRPASYSDAFVCEPCNCHGHSNECVFDEEVNAKNMSKDINGIYEGGGVCQNCQDNTEGINCEKCISTFYRPFGKSLIDRDGCQPCRCNDPSHTGNCEDGTGQCECRPEFMPPYCDQCNFGYYDYPQCKPCDCFRDGTEGGICEVGGGQCPCKPNYKGLNCDQCKSTFYGFPDCLACNCSDVGSTSPICDPQSGQCNCVTSFGGQTCNRCEHGYFNHPQCSFCNCDSSGTTEEICDKETGQCLCKEGYSGSRCDSSAPGFWGYPQIKSCECHAVGAVSHTCDPDGFCRCFSSYSGAKCDQCKVGFYQFPECMPCNCDYAGTSGESCDDNGNCICNFNFDGQKCDRCREGFYIFPRCEECNCNPSGVIESFVGCDKAPEGSLCVCKPRVRGRICDQCEPLYWNLQPYNPDGCEECSCNLAGTVGGLALCNSDDGQCVCKPRVTERRCTTCKDGSFNLMEDNLFGCLDCGCNEGGSLNSFCDKVSGTCQCRPRVVGQRCDKPMRGHYFPNFHHLKYEAEDGRTEYTDAVRFGYDEVQFPGYSWRGYAIFSDIQKETLYDVVIERPSVYRIILFYRNPHEYSVNGKIIITPESPSYTQQELDISYPTTPDGPQLITLTSGSGMLPLILVMDPGHWTIAIQSESDMLLDYFVLLPAAYYEGSLLTKNVTTPCLVENTGETCVHYGYPDVNGRFPHSLATGGFVLGVDENEEPVEVFEKQETLESLGSGRLAWLNEEQSEIMFRFNILEKGSYVILLNYFTPNGGGKAASVAVEAFTSRGMQTGRAVLYDCSYSWACRQVVMDLSGQVGVVDFDTNVAEITIRLQQVGQDIALESVTVVPLNEWTTDLVTPQDVCIMEDGQCIHSSFSMSADTTKVEFESNAAGKKAVYTPRGIPDDAVLVYLNLTDSSVDITSHISNPGDYVFVVHYFQPNFAGFQMRVMVQDGDQFYEGVMPVAHCPSISGCRAIVTHSGGENIFNVKEHFIFTLKDPGNREVWVDYLLAVPAGQFSPALLERQTRDNTAEFINRCGNNHFMLSENTTGFCRDAAFALTVEFNSGALRCECDFYGSYTLDCAEFGGSCPCKPNVIGRRCDRCKTGYFGFPNCQPCDCPSTALCNPRNGECICPPLVYGERCDQCVPETYGFDSIIGCEKCHCSPLGVRSGNLQCDLITGQCDCMDNVVGKRCDKCAAGYWTYPLCQSCDCDIRGTEADICNQNDASCYCKSNVRGRTCDTCVDGSYNLEESNPDGCTRCFCFGKTSACSPSKFYWDKLYNMNGWGAVQLDLSGASLMVSVLPDPPELLNRDVVLQTSNYLAPRIEGVVYLAAPNRFLGNRITSYGGTLTYVLTYLTDAQEVDDSVVASGDVILQGNNVTARYFHDDALTPVTTNIVTVKITERNFRTLSGGDLTREQFMMLLHKLTGVYIRAQYARYSTETRLSDLTLDVASTVHYQGAEPAQSVEQCRCPVNYQGTSCEECSPGFFRAHTGPFGGFCVPCQCNRHSDTCDPITGVCLNCQHNTVGDHCELCGTGYHGDATGQTPNDCLLCACPIPALSNNFADSCIVEANRPPICDCQPGYVGQQCQQCAPGHYGNPRQIGSYCRECECNNNIDPIDPYACDDITGRCLKCLNSTAGDSCEVCEPGFYGDAIERKDCRPCECDLCGTHTCDHHTGVCTCHPNVIGEFCDRCAPDHWGLDFCQGCQPCQCGIAARSSQCDLLSGNCDCSEGATGRFCDRCKPGYWDLTPQGCKECNCREGFSVGVGCDPLTGVCSCLPGVQGENCDGCPFRWVLLEGVGCRECPYCIHTLLDTADELQQLILPTINEFESAAHSFFLNQRLNLINESTNTLRPDVEFLNVSLADLKPVRDAIDNLGAQALLNNVNFLLEHAKDSVINGVVAREDAEMVHEQLANANELGHDVVAEINALVAGLEAGAGAQLEQALIEAETIKERMSALDMKVPMSNAEMELEVARDLLYTVKNFSLPITEQQDMVEDKNDMLSDLQSKVADIEQYISDAEERTLTATTSNENNRQYGLTTLNSRLEDTKNTEARVKGALDEAEDLTSKAETNFDDIKEVCDGLHNDLDTLMVEKPRLNSTVDSMGAQLADSRVYASVAANWTQGLLDRADRLDDLLVHSREVSHGALEAAKAYSNIVDAIENARKAAERANEAGNMAVELSGGVRDNALKAIGMSVSKQTEAEERSTEVETSLEPQLKEAQESVVELRVMTTELRNSVRNIDGHLMKMDDEVRVMDASGEMTRAENIIRTSEDSLIITSELHERQENDVAVARQTLNNAAEAARSYQFANEAIDDLEKQIPRVRNTAVDLLETKRRIRERSVNLNDRLERLRNNIQKTRELANKVRVGVDFQQATTVEVVPPEDPSESATSNSFSLYTRTEDPSGLLLFVGTPVGGHQQMRRTKTDDFMALEIVNGFARLTIDLGSGPESIENRNIYLSDGAWRKISVDRTGMVVRLTVHYEDNSGTEKTDSVERVLPGRFSVLNLSPKVSRVFVGGIPAGIDVDPSIQSTSYVGQVEELMINSHTIGIWNFLNNGTSNIQGRGAYERNRLVDLVPPTGLRFNGDAYAAVNTREVTAFHYESRFVISLLIKTFAEDGILYFLQLSDTEFMVLSLVDGHVRFQLNLGSGMADLKSSDRCNDGEWHSVEAAREQQQAIIKVDGHPNQGVTPGSSVSLRDLPEKMYFGGFPGRHSIRGVTNVDFNGCIGEVQVSTTQFDLVSMSRETRNTVEGCPDEVASLVSFMRSAPGYVRLDRPEGPGIKLVFKFRTSEPNGLLFYTSSRDSASYLTLAIQEGSLMLKASRSGEISTGAFNKYNDSHWHVVIATRENNELRLDIDDYESYDVTLADQVVNFDGPVYFGGAPPHIAPRGMTSFSGCIEDATLNGKVMNFAASEDRPNSRLQSCELVEDDEYIAEPAVPVTPRSHGRTTSDDDYDEEGNQVLQEVTPRQYPKEVFTYYDETTEPQVPDLQQCGLPLHPSMGITSSYSLNNGARFGSKKDSRIEFAYLDDYLRGSFNLTLDFKTFLGEGVIFYAASISHTSFIAIYMNNGRVILSYNNGNGRQVLTGNRIFKDNVWHKLMIVREVRAFTLLIDDRVEAVEIELNQGTRDYYQGPYYLGGLSQNIWELASENMDGTMLSFRGCLRAFRMNGHVAEPEGVVDSLDRCSDDVESGMFFGPVNPDNGERAHVILKSRFSVGHEFHLSMEVKPRTNSAVIMSIHGRKDFLILQLNEGRVEFLADNGNGIIKTSNDPPNPYTYCDGRWHTFQVVKVKNIIVLTVDGESTTSSGSSASTSTDTRHPLFLGSQPRLAQRRGRPVLDMYVGCVRNVTLNEEQLDLYLSTFVGNVNAGSCPTT